MLIYVTRTIKLPDPVKLERYRHCPEIGPRVLFFSGGSALRQICSELIQYTYNSIHIITTFDSGGSSAKLRDAFHMPAIGDVRNRLLSLADRSLHGNHEIFKLFAHRFPEDAAPEVLACELDKMTAGKHSLVANIPEPMRNIIRRHLSLFKKYMPENFDLRKASLGNLILTAGYLDNQRNFDSIIYIFSKLVQVRGVVRPILNEYLHLISELEDGTVIAGQHRLTGKEVSPISSEVKKVWLSSECNKPLTADNSIQDNMKLLIHDAEIICYPMGSFYSSIIANFLPSGVGRAVSQNPCPKIFIPNTGSSDPESRGLDLMGQVDRLLSYLRKDAPESISVPDVLNYILIDEENGNYQGKADREALGRVGIEVINTPLVSPKTRPYIDEKLAVPIILSLL